GDPTGPADGDPTGPADGDPTGPADPGAGPDGGTGAGGHGLTGMRERTRLLGGRFTAGPTGNHGYAVTAYLPYDAEASG
ncbi:hypothetical protein I0C86_11525, partial [Plantactinospora sp. S1510]|nr:hypothetical protein [Plantactinospora alkalitolerans]